MQIGKVTHYYNKINVAVVKLSAPLALGDKVKISGHDKEFIQEIISIEIEHEQVQKAKKGEVIGLKVDKEVKEGDIFYSITS